MKTYRNLDDNELVESLRSDEVGLLPTDTIYGLSCSAYAKDSVERIYDIKGRDKGIPVIVLVGNISDLEKFRIYPDKHATDLLSSNWPGGISFILPVTTGFEYLTRGSASLAFRMPDNQKLLKLIEQTGPLVSTSANPSGQKPADNVQQAVKYFGGKLDFYFDMGDLFGQPSTLVDLTSGSPVVLRQGQTPFKTNF